MFKMFVLHIVLYKSRTININKLINIIIYYIEKVYRHQCTSTRSKNSIKFKTLMILSHKVRYLFCGRNEKQNIQLITIIEIIHTLSVLDEEKSRILLVFTFLFKG